MEPLLDRLGRPLETLRISITDRCNFRCVYCMPKEVFGRDYAFLERSALLSFEEIERVARIFARLGVRTIRITGGEPLVRRNVEHLIALLHATGVELALTTNGALLPKLAQPLAAAGLDRVTVSLDSVDDATFRSLNDVDFPVQNVLDGIDAAAAAGLPVKVNAVVKRGVNDGAQIARLAERFRGTGHTLRFIEYMDVGHTNGWRLDDVVPAQEIVETPAVRVAAVHVLDEADQVARAAELLGERRQLRAVVDAALDDRVHLHRQAGGRGGVDSAEDALDGEVDVVQRAEGDVVDRVERDGDPVEARIFQRLRKLGEQRAVRRQRELEPVDLLQQRDEVLDVAADEGLPARDPHGPHAELPEDARDSGDLLERQEL